MNQQYRWQALFVLRMLLASWIVILLGVTVPAKDLVIVPMEEARADVASSQARIEQIEISLATDPASIEARRALALEYGALADALNRLNGDNAGVQELSQSLRLAHELVEQDPADVESRLVLIEALWLRTRFEILDRPVSERWVDFAREVREEIVALREEARANPELRSRLVEKLRYLVNTGCIDVNDMCLILGVETVAVIGNFADDSPEDEELQIQYAGDLQWFGMLNAIPGLGMEVSDVDAGIALLLRSLVPAARINDASLRTDALVGSHAFLAWAMAGTPRDDKGRSHLKEAISILTLREGQDGLSDQQRSCLESLQTPKEDTAETISPCVWLGRPLVETP